jgi:hypothetical protein
LIDKKFADAIKKIDMCAYGKPVIKEEKFAKLASKLDAMGLINIPNEYKTFLSFMNGYMYNSVEFFSIGDEKLVDNGYELMNVVNANEIENTKQKDASKILIGRTDEDVFCFDNIEKKYQILDRIDWAVMEDFNSLEELMTYELS